MKKFLILLLFIPSFEVHALCPLDPSGENICTVTDFENKMPIGVMQQANSINFSTEQKPTQPENFLTPLNTGINKNNNQFQYDSVCQFGVCLDDINNINNKNQ